VNKVIYTVGHSTHPLDEFIRILDAYVIKEVVDVRTIPKSRHNPQFNEENLGKELPKHGIGYVRLKGLGGLRHPAKESVNTAWRNASFRGFADYMQAPEFAAAIEALISLAEGKRIAIMCAERLPRRCHRSLIGDALLVRDIKVEDIMDEKSSRPHRLTQWAKVERHAITYPGPADI